MLADDATHRAVSEVVLLIETCSFRVCPLVVYKGGSNSEVTKNQT